MLICRKTGLSEEELERLASLGKSVQKTAGRDIPHVVSHSIYALLTTSGISLPIAPS